MKYSNYIGIVFALCCIYVCYAPWVYIPTIQTVVTGMHAPNTNFGHPGLLNIILSVIAIVMFSIPTIWAKRTNIFVTTFNVAWAFRSFLFVTHCELGECPEKKWGIYALMIISALILVMALLPKMNIEVKK